MKNSKKIREMRNAIDNIEGALMGCDKINFEELHDLFRDTNPEVEMRLTVTLGQFIRLCDALAECNRIINSDEFTLEALL
jgi:hypothetical protein